MYAAGKDSARPAESDDGNSNKYKKPKYFVQTSRKYCNKHDIPVGYDKHGLCSLCDCVDSNVGKTTNRKFYGVRQSYCTPWIPQDIPLKKKTRELPQVKMLDTIEEFVVDFAESKHDEVYHICNDHGSIPNEDYTRAAEKPMPVEVNPSHTFNSSVCEWPSLGESLVCESKEETDLQQWILCPRKCDCEFGYNSDSYSITDGTDNESSWVGIHPIKVMSFVEVLKKNQQKMKNPKVTKPYILVENMQSAQGNSSRKATVSTQNPEEDILNQYYHSKFLLAKCRPRNHATKNSRKGVLSFPRYGRKQNRQRSSGRRRFG